MYFEGHGVNPFVDADEDHRSTFALDGDTGSFEVARLYLDYGELPPADSVRVEEWVNAFAQGYSGVAEGLGIRLDGMMSPFGPEGYRLMRVGIASARPEGERAPVSLLFVLDISGSMDGDGRLGLAKLVIVGLADLLASGDRGRLGNLRGPGPGGLPGFGCGRGGIAGGESSRDPDRGRDEPGRGHGPGPTVSPATNWRWAGRFA